MTNLTKTEQRAAAKRAATARAEAQRAAAAKRRQLMTVGGAAAAVLLIAALVGMIAGGVGPFASDKKDTVKTGAADKAPVVTKGEGDVTELKVTTLKQGDGAEVKSGQTISVQYTGVIYKDGKKFDSSWDRGKPAEFVIGVGKVIPGWDKGLVGVKIGSRVQLDIPADQAYGETAEGGRPAGDLRFVVDILSAKDGAKPVDPKDAPKVTKGEGDVTELKVTTLKQGDGAEVKSGQTISVHYTGVIYKDGKKFDSSWDTGQPAEFPIGVGQVIKGWDKGLVGVKIGSRVQLDIPADQAYGETAEGGRPAGDLRFVVDILSAK